MASVEARLVLLIWFCFGTFAASQREPRCGPYLCGFGTDGSCSVSIDRPECRCSEGHTRRLSTTTWERIQYCRATCVNNSCKPGYKCLNGKCYCDDGFERTRFGNCVDVNECFRSNDCDDDALCENKPGSYECHSKASVTCDDVRCDQNSTCVKGACVCKTGFLETTSGTCNDVDECSQPTVCNQTSVCQNLQGSYRCVNKTLPTLPFQETFGENHEPIWLYLVIGLAVLLALNIIVICVIICVRRRLRKKRDTKSAKNNGPSKVTGQDTLRVYEDVWEQPGENRISTISSYSNLGYETYEKPRDNVIIPRTPARFDSGISNLGPKHNVRLPEIPSNTRMLTRRSQDVTSGVNSDHATTESSAENSSGFYSEAKEILNSQQTGNRYYVLEPSYGNNVSSKDDGYGFENVSSGSLPRGGPSVTEVDGIYSSVYDVQPAYSNLCVTDENALSKTEHFDNNLQGSKLTNPKTEKDSYDSLGVRRH